MLSILVKFAFYFSCIVFEITTFEVEIFCTERELEVQCHLCTVLTNFFNVFLFDVYSKFFLEI